MNTEPSEARWWMMLFPLSAAIFYVLSNVCMRTVVDEANNSIYLGIAIRESIAFLVAVPIYVWLLSTKRTPVPRAKHLGIFILIGIFVQLFGNVVQLVGFQAIGMGASASACWVGLLLGAPVAGWIFLREKMSARLAVGIGIVISALMCLAFGAEVQESAKSIMEVAPHTAAKFVLLSLTAGIIFAFSNAANRWMNHAGNSPILAILLLPGLGALLVGGLDWYLHGFDSWMKFSHTGYLFAFLSGVANMIAFSSLTVGLHFLKVVRVATINVSQLIFTPLLGCLLFHELMNFWLAAGVLLTITGIVTANSEGVAHDENQRPT